MKKSIWAEKSRLFKIFFDSGKRIYAKNYQIEDRLGYPEVLSASSYGCSKVSRQGGSLDLSFSLYLVIGRATGRDPPGTNRHTDRQTDKAPQPNPLTHRTQGPKYAARHPLALI